KLSQRSRIEASPPLSSMRRWWSLQRRAAPCLSRSGSTPLTRAICAVASATSALSSRSPRAPGAPASPLERVGVASPISRPRRSLRGWLGRERPKLVLPLTNDAPTRLWNLVPGAGEVAERLRDDQPRLVREPVQHGVVGVLVPEGAHVCRVEERPGPPLARVTEGPDLCPVARSHRHLDRMLDAVSLAGLLDEPNRSLDRHGWIVLEPEREREEEEQL